MKLSVIVPVYNEKRTIDAILHKVRAVDTGTTKEIIIVSGGAINLNTEDIGLDFHTQVRKGFGLSAGMVLNPFIRLGGKLVSPTIELDPEGVVVKGTVAVATMGLSVVGRSLYDRFLASKDPCGQALEKLLEADAEKQ